MVQVVDGRIRAPFKEAAESLERGFTLSPETEVERLALDGLRGSLNELRWRSTLAEYLKEASSQDQTDLIARTRARLQNAPEEIDWVPQDPLVSPGVGVGTYKLKSSRLIALALRGSSNGYPNACLVDTAETYGYGRVEEQLGQELSPWGVELPLATKVSRTHMSASSVQNAICRSLGRLGMPYLYLYQLHWPNPKFPIRETMAALWEARGEGLIQNIGVCNMSLDQIFTAQAALPSVDVQIRSLQVRYNIQDREAEWAVKPYCDAMGISLIAYSPLGQSFKKFLAADKKGLIKRIGLRRRTSPAEVALGWLLAKGAVPIPATNSLDHLRANLSATPLTPEQVEELDKEFG